MKVIYNEKEIANNTKNYNELLNKPLINSIELVGNTTLNDLNVYNKNQVDNLIASTRSVKVVSALPTPVVANTMYYVGPNADDLYRIYLVDSSLAVIDLGLSQDTIYKNGDAIRINLENEINVKYDDKTLEINSEGELAVIAAENTTAYMNGHLLDSESTSINTDIVWHGTQAQYDLITTKNPNTVYFIEDAPPYLNALYPVGSIYMSATLSTAAQVNSALGGTWQAWGAGRVPVGVDTSDTDFNTVQKTGGSKTANHRHWQSVGTDGTLYATHASSTSGAIDTRVVSRFRTQYSSVGEAVTASTREDTTYYNDTPNLQPYITCYMYLRIA